MEMHPNYTSLSFDYYGADKGQTYNKKWAYQNATFHRPPRPLVTRPTGEFVSHLEL